MPQLLFNQWFTAGRALLIGGLATVIFFVTPEGRLVSVTTAHALTALVAAFTGVSIGFQVAIRPRVLSALSKIGGHHYSLAGAMGFVLLALWASEGGSVWPLTLWFFPAGMLEAFVSSIGRARTDAS